MFWRKKRFFKRQYFVAISLFSGIDRYKIANAIALCLPWQAYTAIVDPNAGKLLKAHLTGGNQDSPESLATMLMTSYTSISWHD